jgi:hypothetical protein
MMFRTFILAALFSCLNILFLRSQTTELKVVDGFLPSAFPLVSVKSHTVIFHDMAEDVAVVRAIQDLSTDCYRVTKKSPPIRLNAELTKYPVIIGTIGVSKTIDRLIANKHIRAEHLVDKWESFVITTVEKPFDGVEMALVIAGSDRRGTIYGIYELSQQLGVSPWHWWADVPPLQRNEAYIPTVYYASGEPAVKYRGIFINDEIPAMKRWATKKFGGMNSKMYAQVFELLLRLRANYLWPGMWGSMRDYSPEIPMLFDENGEYEGISFNQDDPLNPKMAHDYGIVMGTSHHEPMQRSQQEWMRNKKNYGNGEWNYMTNKAGIRKFFEEGIENTKNYESIITLGMRGDDDKPMVDAGSVAANFKILEGIITDQRRIIQNVTKKPLAKTPQVWTLYKEVLDYYELGLQVPNDVIVLLCDDDWGDVRRLPNLNSQIRPGGYGMYYHVAYYGAPRASKWLNNSQIQHMWEQLQLTYDYGVDKIWIINVGDIKPLEYPMDFFLKMAWNPKAFNAQNLNDYSIAFCAQQLGGNNAREAADILNAFCKFSARMFPEMLDHKTYHLESGEFLFVKNEFLALEAKALRLYVQMPEAYKDVYYQLILYPVQALANLYEMYYAVAMNSKLANEKNIEANKWADKVEACFVRDAELTNYYNTQMAGGKWNHMMDQVRIGYSSWHPPVKNIMPNVQRIAPHEHVRGEYLFKAGNDVVVMEAEHYFSAKANVNTSWTVIPDLGRTKSGLALFPYTQSTHDAMLSYKYVCAEVRDSVAVHIIFDCTLPFQSRGHRVEVGFENAQAIVLDINSDLTWKNNYSKMYPAAGQRIIEKLIKLKLPQHNVGDTLIFQLSPLDPGVVFHKIIVDYGGFLPTHLKMQESDYIRLN